MSNALSYIPGAVRRLLLSRKISCIHTPPLSVLRFFRVIGLGGGVRYRLRIRYARALVVFNHLNSISPSVSHRIIKAGEDESETGKTPSHGTRISMGGMGGWNQAEHISLTANARLTTKKGDWRVYVGVEEMVRIGCRML